MHALQEKEVMSLYFTSVQPRVLQPLLAPGETILRCKNMNSSELDHAQPRVHVWKANVPAQSHTWHMGRRPLQ